MGLTFVAKEEKKNMTRLVADWAPKVPASSSWFYSVCRFVWLGQPAANGRREEKLSLSLLFELFFHLVWIKIYIVCVLFM